MIFLKYFHVQESELVGEPAKVLVRCLSRGEVALVKSEGCLTPQSGASILAIMPLAEFRELLKGKAFPAYGSSPESWTDLDTGLAPPEAP